jgi:hypothetical protein
VTSVEANCAPAPAEDVGDGQVVVGLVATPGIFGPRYFQEIAEVLAGSPGGPPDLNVLFGVMARHGLTPAIPGASTTGKG